jgi:hypothetical protein
MMFLHALTSWLRKRTPEVKTPTPPSTRLQLEQLEDRIVPQNFTFTYVNAAVQITPGFPNVTETVTATVTNRAGFNPDTGQTIPAGAFGNPTSGIVLFFLNGQVRSANLNANSQATATFQIPTLAFFAGQKLDVYYNGTDNLANQDFWGAQTFRAPLYTNFDNLLLPSRLTFATLTQQQVDAFEINSAQNRNLNQQDGLPPAAFPTLLRPDYTANGETNTVGNNLITFNYVDPGVINTVQVLGFQLPGIFAIPLGAFNGLTSSSSSSS